jgi:uncharacterized protein YbjT (DUF2867 family)
MPTPILVTGGTGTLGKLVTARLRAAGQPVRVLSRKPRPAAAGVEYVVGDLTSGLGVGAAVDGMETIVHCAGSARGDGEKARTLVRAAKGAGDPYIVNISVVGADRVPVVSAIDKGAFGYFAMKRVTEDVIANSGLPWTTLRATQFHELTLMVVRGMAKLPIIPVPSGFRFQPIDGDDVAARMVELALAEPAGLVPDLAGPRIYTLRDLLRSYLHAAGQRRLLVPLRVPGGAARAVRDGANLAPDHAEGRRTWEDFLAAHVRSAPRSAPAPA